MRSIDSKTILAVTKAQLISSHEDHFTGIGTDSRADLSGQLFIALKGEAFDAHNFLSAALEKGAKALLIHDQSFLTDEIRKSATVFLVNDTLVALQLLGNWARHQSQAKIIGITGSNGKTTTKEFTAAVLNTVYSVHYNKGSFNNHWGVPFTLLQLPKEREIAVVEMGMNHAGELTELSKIVEPDVVVCTTVGRAHMEFFGSLEKVAEAKEEIYLSAKESAIKVFNLDNELTLKMYERARKTTAAKNILTFSSKNAAANVFLELENMTLNTLTLKGVIDGISGQAEVQVFGLHNINNIMAAAAIGLAVGMTADQIWSAIPRCKTIWGRNQIIDTESGAQIIFDAYNANPDSMNALIKNMKAVSISGRKIGVFGQMREMGPSSPQLHKELGTWVGAADFERVFFIGDDFQSFQEGLKEAAFKGKATLAQDFNEELESELSLSVANKDLVCFKASRGTKLERLMPACKPLNFNYK